MSLSLGYTWASFGVFPSPNPHRSPGNLNALSRNILRLKSERTSAGEGWGTGRLRWREAPDCLLGPVWGLGGPSRSLAEPTAPALINGPQPAGGAGQRIRAEKGNYSRPAALGFPQARLKCHISDAAPRSACLLREPGPGGRKPTRKCIGD